VPQSQENAISPTLLRLPCQSTDYDVVIELVGAGSKVLDLGCGSGELLARLIQEKQISGRGLDIDPELVIRCVEKGLSVVQGNLDEGLAQYRDKSFDWVVLNQTLQVTHRPALVLREMLRVGRTGIVSFPKVLDAEHPLADDSGFSSALSSGGRTHREGNLPLVGPAPAYYFCTQPAQRRGHLCRVQGRQLVRTGSEI